MKKPLVVVTMGDPTGIGPEIIAAALGRHDLGGVCRPVVLGDPGALARGIAVAGLPLRIREIGEHDLPVESESGVVHLIPCPGWMRQIWCTGHRRGLRFSGVPLYYDGGAPLLGRASRRHGHRPHQQGGAEPGRACLSGHTELLAELTGTPSL